MLKAMTEEEWRKVFEPGDMIVDYTSRDLSAAVTWFKDHIWTELECDGVRSITSGWHYVNRVGYYVTKQAVPLGQTIDVITEDD